nr:hypothetical protein Iba_chr03bCG14390 [Ipomoea batatas]
MVSKSRTITPTGYADLSYWFQKQEANTKVPAQKGLLTEYPSRTQLGTDCTFLLCPGNGGIFGGFASTGKCIFGGIISLLGFLESSVLGSSGLVSKILRTRLSAFLCSVFGLFVLVLSGLKSVNGFLLRRLSLLKSLPPCGFISPTSGVLATAELYPSNPNSPRVLLNIIMSPGMGLLVVRRPFSCGFALIFMFSSGDRRFGDTHGGGTEIRRSSVVGDFLRQRLEVAGHFGDSILLHFDRSLVRLVVSSQLL